MWGVLGDGRGRKCNMLMSHVVVAAQYSYFRCCHIDLLDRFDASSSACRKLFFLFNFVHVLLVLCMPQIMFGAPLTLPAPSSQFPVPSGTVNPPSPRRAVRL